MVKHLFSWAMFNNRFVVPVTQWDPGVLFNSQLELAIGLWIWPSMWNLCVTPIFHRAHHGPVTYGLGPESKEFFYWNMPILVLEKFRIFQGSWSVRTTLNIMIFCIPCYLHLLSHACGFPARGMNSLMFGAPVDGLEWLISGLSR